MKEPSMTTDPFAPLRSQYGELAPKFVDLTIETLFGDVWERPGLSKRDRSLITVAALVAMNRAELKFHLERALQNGLSKDELVEAITHLAFYSGWPTSMTALGMAKAVFAEGGGEDGPASPADSPPEYRTWQTGP
jgi:4-carboxymuconolactone decarboxylase